MRCIDYMDNNGWPGCVSGNGCLHKKEVYLIENNLDMKFNMCFNEEARMGSKNLKQLIEAMKIVPIRTFPDVPEYVHHSVCARMAALRESPLGSEDRKFYLNSINRLFDKVLEPRYGDKEDFLVFYAERILHCVEYQEKKQWRVN